MTEENETPDIDSAGEASQALVAERRAPRTEDGDSVLVGRAGVSEVETDRDVERESIDSKATASTQSDIDTIVSSGRPNIRRMLASASATAILQGASAAMAFVLAVLLARFLGSGGYGRYAVAYAWSTLLGVPAILGLNTFLVRGISEYEVREQWGLMKGLLFRSNQLVLFTTTVVAVCGATVAVTSLSPSFRGPFCVAMLLIPITSLTLLRQGAMQAFGQVVKGQFPEFLIRPVLIIVGVIALEFVGHDALTPTTALGANVAGVAVAFVVGAVMLRRTLPAALRTVRPEYVTREWLRVSLPIMLIAGVWVANNYLTTLILGALDGARAAGVYTAVQKGAEVIVIVLYASNMSLAPAIARLHARRDWQGLEHTTEHMARATLLVSAPVALAFMVFPHVYLDLFGAGFQTGATALIILALGQLINAAAGPSGNVLLMTGHERMAVRGVAAGLLANVVLAVVLVPPFGVTGGAIAFASGLALWNALLVVFARRLVGVNVTAFHRLAVVRSIQ
jgi:O-antigen/teichoic acid export membrane protein